MLQVASCLKKFKILDVVQKQSFTRGNRFISELTNRYFQIFNVRYYQVSIPVLNIKYVVQYRVLTIYEQLQCNEQAIDKI